MAFETTTFLDINEQTLTEVIGLVETQTLEFKRDAYGEKDADRKEFLADISAMANSQGGYILIGIAEKDGAAKELLGIEGSADQLILRYEQIARTALQPRIPDLSFKPVTLRSGRFVLVIAIPQSFDGPHRVIYQGKNAFFARAGAGKYEPDVTELRAMFMKTISIAERVRAFHESRVSNVISQKTPIGFSLPALVMHIMPLSALSGANQLNMRALHDKWQKFVPTGSGNLYSLGRRVNLDGILVFAGPEPVDVYTQIWKNGTIETCVKLFVGTDRLNNPYIHADYIEQPLVRSIQSQITALDEIGVKGPFAIHVTLLGLKAVALEWGKGFHIGREAQKFDRNPIPLPEILIPSAPKDDKELGEYCRNTCDAIFHAAGLLASTNFDADGRHVVRDS